MTTTATRQADPEFGREHTLYLRVRVARVEWRDELFGSAAPIHVEGEQSEVFAADVARQALQQPTVMVLGRAVASYECQDVGHEP